MPSGFARWDAAEVFRSEEEARLFIEEVAKDGTPDELRSAIGTVARYFGVIELARRTGISSKRIFTELNSLSDEQKTLFLLLKRLGVTPGLADETARDAAE
jgi:probable addiction module antidote protein